MMLDDATDHLVPTNPLLPRRHRGRRTRYRRAEPAWATPDQVNAVATHARILGGDTAATLIVTAAYTGARWGELTGLQHTNAHPDKEFNNTTEHSHPIDPTTRLKTPRVQPPAPPTSTP
ncbi:hypothetical protein HUO13_27960 [Saccharopolyspora erythraea]|uniref:hypothetical protein n=1 Tax=Saccharopolyspora erythraea TaxID=1836 RepID=UPI001BAC7B66|nr:hypothetical protein [Saccharopolyspora erythraea]QUH04125.1 hypothetical protein HUO13_27960 [Saccharopolyspora erythraea]